MSMKSSIKQLEMFNKDKIFIMGDMGELGDEALEHHIDIFRLQRIQYKISTIHGQLQI